MTKTLVNRVNMDKILAGAVTSGWMSGNLTADLFFPTEKGSDAGDVLGVVIDAEPFGARHWRVRIRDVDLRIDLSRELYFCTRPMAVARALRDYAEQLRAHVYDVKAAISKGDEPVPEGEEPVEPKDGCILVVLRGRLSARAAFRFTLVPDADTPEDEVESQHLRRALGDARWDIGQVATLAGFRLVDGTWEADEGAAAERLVKALEEDYWVVLRGTWTDGAPSGEDDYEGMCDGMAARDYERDAYGYDLDEGYPDHRSAEY